LLIFGGIAIEPRELRAFEGGESAVGSETPTSSPAVSKAICLSEEGGAKLEKIVILTERPQTSGSLISYLSSLFPGCQIKTLPRPVALIGKGTTDPRPRAPGNGKQKEEKGPVLSDLESNGDANSETGGSKWRFLRDP
jgi:hypothetical protein